MNQALWLHWIMWVEVEAGEAGSILKINDSYKWHSFATWMKTYDCIWLFRSTNQPNRMFRFSAYAKIKYTRRAKSFWWEIMEVVIAERHVSQVTLTLCCDRNTSSKSFHIPHRINEINAEQRKMNIVYGKWIGNHVQSITSKSCFHLKHLVHGLCGIQFTDSLR